MHHATDPWGVGVVRFWRDKQRGSEHGGILQWDEREYVSFLYSRRSTVACESRKPAGSLDTPAENAAASYESFNRSRRPIAALWLGAGVSLVAPAERSSLFLRCLEKACAPGREFLLLCHHFHSSKTTSVFGRIHSVPHLLSLSL